MNEEEKKAIEQLKYMNEDGCEKCVYGEDKTCINCWEAHKEIILNLIEKQNKKLKEIEAIVDTTPYVAYTSYGDILYESDEILEIIRSDGNE